MIKSFIKELKITFLSVKYSIMKEMLNKFTFLTNVIFMILNNASFILEWVIIFSIKLEIAGYGMREVLLLWGVASGTYGLSHLFFGNSIHLSDLIVNGELDAYLVQPKDVLLSAISSRCEISAIGDIIYSYIMLILYGFNIASFILYTLGIICGAVIYTSVMVIYHSLAFWFGKVDTIAETVGMIFINFATYPGTTFKGTVRFLLYTLTPVGIANYLPVNMVFSFDLPLFMILIGCTFAFAFLAHGIFDRGLMNYSSSNLMNARV